MNRLASKEYGTLEDINGLAFKKGREIIFTKPRELMTSEELSKLPYPFYNEDTRKNVLTGVIETSRGCPNRCNFCTEHKIGGGKYRTKNIDYVIEGLRQTKYMGRNLFFLDNNLIGTPTRAINLLEEIANEKLNNRFGIAQVTIKAGENPKLMRAMKNAGINSLCIGIESINDETLKALGKPYTAEQNKESIKNLRNFGFWIHGMLMPGGDGDTPKSLRKDFQWIIKNLDSIQLFPPTPLPGSDFCKEMEDTKRILTKDYSLYDAQHVVIRPKNFTPYELQTTINQMYLDFYNIKNSLIRLKDSKQKGIAMGLMIYNHAFGGIKKVLKAPQTQAHLDFLKSIS